MYFAIFAAKPILIRLWFRLLCKADTVQVVPFAKLASVVRALDHRVSALCLYRTMPLLFMERTCNI